MDSLWPVGGGTFGGFITGVITFGEVGKVILFAALGALVGWLIKEFLDYCKRKLL